MLTFDNTWKISRSPIYCSIHRHLAPFIQQNLVPVKTGILFICQWGETNIQAHSYNKRMDIY